MGVRVAPLLPFHWPNRKSLTYMSKVSDIAMEFVSAVECGRVPAEPFELPVYNSDEFGEVLRNILKRITIESSKDAMTNILVRQFSQIQPTRPDKKYRFLNNLFSYHRHLVIRDAIRQLPLSMNTQVYILEELSKYARAAYITKTHHFDLVSNELSEDLQWLSGLLVAAIGYEQAERHLLGENNREALMPIYEHWLKVGWNPPPSIVEWLTATRLLRTTS